MPQANDAELTELYTAATGLVAGNVIGNGAANYRLRIDCIDDTLAAPNAAMSPGTLNQQFNPPTAGSPAERRGTS